MGFACACVQATHWCNKAIGMTCAKSCAAAGKPTPSDCCVKSSSESGLSHRRSQETGPVAAYPSLTIAELVGRLHEHDGQLAEQLTRMLADKEEMMRSAKAEATVARAVAAAAEAKFAQRVGEQHL